MVAARHFLQMARGTPDDVPQAGDRFFFFHSTPGDEVAVGNLAPGYQPVDLSTWCRSNSLHGLGPQVPMTQPDTGAMFAP